MGHRIGRLSARRRGSYLPASVDHPFPHPKYPHGIIGRAIELQRTTRAVEIQPLGKNANDLCLPAVWLAANALDGQMSRLRHLG